MDGEGDDLPSPPGVEYGERKIVDNCIKSTDGYFAINVGTAENGHCPWTIPQSDISAYPAHFGLK